MAKMSEFDFDELDKAVAGVINTEADSDTVSEQSREEEITPEPVVVEPASTTDLETPAPVALATRRSSGRFMDVVHPSSDMRTRTGTATLASPGSTAPQSSFTPPVAKPEPAYETATPTANVESDGIAELDAVVGEWTKPLESPFLTDAKVEKRPLGGVGPEPSQILLDAPEEELKLEAPDEPLLEATLPDPIDFAAQTAAAALANEKEDTGNLQFVEKESDSEQTTSQINEAETPKVETFQKSPEVPIVASPVAEEPVRPTSITQQYTEQTSSAQQSGSIFDTENYHKPFVPAAKKHSGVWTIVWILLLVVLGAGAGVAFYLFVLPLL